MRFYVILAVLMMIIFVQLVQRIRCDASLRALGRQLDEIACGSHIELCVQSRMPQILALCRKLNELLAQKDRQHLQYDKLQKQLKQNITGLAHDIRTPLTGAAGYVQLAQECGQASRQQQYLQIALDRMKELGDMLEELFLYTRLTSEAYVPDIREIQVLPLLSDCLLGMYSQFEEKGMEPQVHFQSEGFRVLADEECLQRIFHNLIRNALVHGTGTLVIRQMDSCLIFENQVLQTGQPDPAQMFDRFYKANSTRRKGSSGLGLFIVKELAEKMGGSVKAQLKGDQLGVLLELGPAVPAAGAGALERV